MILVDTSVWIDHLRARDASLTGLLEGVQVLGHPFVIGEIALGSLSNPDAVTDAMSRLPSAILAEDTEVLILIGAESLGGSGIGYVDAHLLASARLSSARLWTRDKRLLRVAQGLSLHVDWR